MKLNKGEYGDVIYVNFGQDISSATSLTIEIEPKFGEKLTKVAGDGVSVGSSNVAVADQIYLANRYLKYTTKSGDIDKSGQWRYRGTANLSSTSKLVTDFELVRVLD